MYIIKETEGNRDVCDNCENERNSENIVIQEKIEKETQIKGKSKIAAGLFGIFFGAFGIHNFYLGYTGKAIAQLLITILTFGVLSFVSAIWGLIEGILILTGDIDKDGKGNPIRD